MGSNPIVGFCRSCDICDICHGATVHPSAYRSLHVRGGESRASVIASPVLVGAVTVLIVIVGVYLAYNANKGLPFVPTYELKAEVPNGQKLITGNEIRLGGFRVGVVNDVRPVIRNVNGKPKAIALVDLKLDKDVEPLGVDTEIA